MTVDDIGREHVSRVRVGVTKKVSKAHGWKRVVIVEGAFVELYHDLNADLMMENFSWQMMKLFKSTPSRREANRDCASAGKRRPQTPTCRV